MTGFNRTLSLLLALLLALCVLPACAEEGDGGAGILEYAELTEWAGSYLERARGIRPLNDPHDPEAFSEDGYAFVYDFATLWLDSPEMTEDSVLRAVLVTAEEETGPRGTRVDMPVSELLASFYCENPDLLGDHDFAGLYAVDLLPDAACWAWAQRDGQRLMAVQYAVQEQLAAGGEGYTDAGLVYTVQENLVAAIRAYGLDAAASYDDVSGNLEDVADVFRQTGYRQFPVSEEGTDLAPFNAEEIDILPRLPATPEVTEAAFGLPVEEEWEEADGGWLRTMDYGPFQLAFRYSADRTDPTPAMLEIVDEGGEGPRGVRIGDSFHSVYTRFRHGEGEYDPETMTELLYGDPDGDECGLAVYTQDTGAELRFTCPYGDGTALLVLSFDQLVLYDILLQIIP